MGSNFVLNKRDENTQSADWGNKEKIFEICCRSNKGEKIKIKVLYEIAIGSVCGVYLVELLHPSRQKKFFAMKASEIDEKNKLRNFQILEKEFEVHSKFSCYRDYFVEKKFNPSDFKLIKTMFEEKQLNFVVPYGPYFIINDLDEILNDEEPEGLKYFCFLMEPCEMSVRGLLKQMKEGKCEIPLDFKLLNILEIFESMDFMNRKNIIHRDIRPDNLLVYRHEFTYKNTFISDHPFYCSKIVDFGKSSTGLCMGGRGSGKTTPWFTAPENKIEGVLYDTKSDVWGIGVLSMMFIMELDFDNQEVKEFLLQKVEAFKKETTYPRYIDELLDFILNHMICERENRFDMVECWKFVRRFFLLHLIKESFKDPKSSQEILFRIAKKVSLFPIKESNFGDLQKLGQKKIGSLKLEKDTELISEKINGMFPFDTRVASEKITLFDTLLFIKKKNTVITQDAFPSNKTDSLKKVSFEIWGDAPNLYSRIRTEDSTKFTVREKIPNESDILCLNDFDSEVGKYFFVDKFRRDFCESWCYNCLKKKNKLKRCSGCRMVHYCSRKCQREDWKPGVGKWRPHKYVCKAINEKNIRFGKEMEYPEMKDTFDYYDKNPLTFDKMISFKVKKYESASLQMQYPYSTIKRTSTWKKMMKMSKSQENLLKTASSLSMTVLQLSSNEYYEIFETYTTSNIQNIVREGKLQADFFENMIIRQYKSLFDEEKNPEKKGIYATSIAKFLYQNFKYQESNKYCKISWELNKSIQNKIEVFKIMGCNEWKLGKCVLAVKNLEDSLLLQKDYSDSYFFLGKVLKDLNYIEKAIHYFSKCFHISFRSFQYLLDKSEDKYPKFESEILRQRTLCCMSLKNIAICVECQYKFAEAKQYMKWTLDLNPFDPTARGSIKIFEKNERIIKESPNLYDILDSSDYMEKVDRGIFN